MKRASLACCEPWRRVWTVLVPWLLATASALVQAQVQTVDWVQATLEPEGIAPFEQALTLPHRWDRSFPGRGGAATYRFSIPTPEASTTMGIYLPRVGNQVAISVNGQVVRLLGVLGQPEHDAAKAPVLI